MIPLSMLLFSIPKAQLDKQREAVFLQGRVKLWSAVAHRQPGLGHSGQHQ